MLDPNFQRSVVLLCEHDPTEGTVGYVLNQPASIQLKDVIEDLAEAEFPLFSEDLSRRKVFTSSTNARIS